MSAREAVWSGNGYHELRVGIIECGPVCCLLKTLSFIVLPTFPAYSRSNDRAKS